MRIKFQKNWIHGLLMAFTAGSAAASSQTLCTIAADASTGKVLVQEGDCTTRVTPASTFKIALSLMGFDSGILQDSASPSMPYKEGYPDWGGEPWRQPTNPERWMKYSVVWFSQQIARQLGESRFQGYTHAFRYGNQDVSGEPRKNNGTSGAWIISSLRISPLEQVRFLEKVVNRRLPVTAHAYDMTSLITRVDAGDTGLEIHGKTGTGSPGSNGQYDPTRAYGWFVGWAIKDSHTVVFAHLIQDDRPTTPNAGLRARDDLIKLLPSLMKGSLREENLKHQ